MPVLHHYTKSVNEVLSEVGVIVRKDKTPDKQYSYVVDIKTAEIAVWLLKKTNGSFRVLKYLDSKKKDL